jgi:hypothetical protein
MNWLLMTLCDRPNTVAGDHQLFRLFDTLPELRLVIFDHFDDLLDCKGYARSDHPCVSTWLDLLSCRPCTSRLLLTSRLLPQGTYERPPVAYIQEFLVQGLDINEGKSLLRMWGIQASEAALSQAVTHFQGHMYALILLGNLLNNDSNLRITTLLNDPWQMQRVGHLLAGLLDLYVQQLHQEQRDLLLAFSLYREAVPLEAAHTIIEAWGVKRRQAFALHTLLAGRLLQPSGDGRYALHPLINDFFAERFVEGEEQTHTRDRVRAHAAAAYYWQHLSTPTSLPRERR